MRGGGGGGGGGGGFGGGGGGGGGAGWRSVVGGGTKGVLGLFGVDGAREGDVDGCGGGWSVV
jgi:hypothetical protein